MFLNYVTLYTDNYIIKYMGFIMKKVCRTCSVPKELFDFYKRQLDCILCWNFIRRERNKKAVCGNCKIEFRPGIEGRYKFCSEICRFMIKVNKDDVTGCWLWKGHIQKKQSGYGTFVPIGERSGLAHRAAFRLFKGTLDDKLILHTCDNTICVNPDHLFKGTFQDNVDDMIKKGRDNFDHKKKK